MSPQKRISGYSGKCYFITTNTYRHRKIFVDEKKVLLLLGCISHLERRGYLKLYAWVILLDHLHLLLEVTGRKNVSELMQSIKGNFSWMVNGGAEKMNDAHARKHELRIGKHELRIGKHELRAGNTYYLPAEQAFQPAQRKHEKIWQSSFYDHIIRDEQDFNNHLNYIQNNPVKHGYIGRSEDWEWSSFG